MYIIIVTFRNNPPDSAFIIDGRFPRVENGNEAIYQIHEDAVPQFMKHAEYNRHVLSCQKYRFEP